MHGLSSIDLPAPALVFVVGPNNGGKSTFLREINSRIGNVSGTKWIEKIKWNVGTENDFNKYISRFFEDTENVGLLKNKRTGSQTMRSNIHSFYIDQTTSSSDFLARMLDAQGRINLADQTDAPSVIEKKELHAYHSFFFNDELEARFSDKIKAAFGKDFRINRTGRFVGGYLGAAPQGDRLSTEYETAIITEMTSIMQFGDGVRSYTGILLNSIADWMPITTIDEPEAFLHPPQARRLGHEIADSISTGTQQVFVATHSSDFIQGALSSGNRNIFFVYLDHSNKERPVFQVSRDVVEDFSKRPFLSHTNALDALFYDQAIICEGEADIMFFKWALEGTNTGRQLAESFWISSYGKSAIPAIMSDLLRLGVKVKAIFDLDVLLSADIIKKICGVVGLDFAKYTKLLQQISISIKVPPTAEALGKIENIIQNLSEEEGARLTAIREIKRAAEGLGKSWTLKSMGVTALPKGEIYSQTLDFIAEMRSHGVVILEEGEIENYVPQCGGHGQTWVRAALDAGSLSPSQRDSIERQFAAMI